MMTLLRRMRGDAAGATTVEYGLVGALIVIGSIGAYSELGESLKTSFGGASGCMKAASGEPGECPQLP
jgi:pilus assembly protein Flp/PilA